MKILAIGAHADDVELGCGGSLARWRDEGHDLHILIVSDSGYYNPEGELIRSSADAYQEAQRSAEKLKAELTIGTFKNLQLEFDEPLNAFILNKTEKIKPDLILTHWSGDSNHDHQMVAQSSIHCSRHIDKVLCYCSNWYMSNDNFNPRMFMEINNYIDEKQELIRIFATENQRTLGKWEHFVRVQAQVYGLKASTDFAEAFEVIKWVQ